MMEERNPDKTYTVDEIMQLLSVSRETVYNWIRAGKIAAVRIGRQYRVTKEHYDKFIKDHTVNYKGLK